MAWTGSRRRERMLCRVVRDEIYDMTADSDSGWRRAWETKVKSYLSRDSDEPPVVVSYIDLIGERDQ
jgi:hypothetical protein